MTTKICKQCSADKDILEFPLSFNKDKSKFWPRSICKICTSDNKKLYVSNNRDEINSQMRTYRKNNPDKIRKIKKFYYENNKDVIIEKSKQYVIENYDKVSSYQKDYSKNNKEKIARKNFLYKENNKDKLNFKVREIYKNNIFVRLRTIISKSIRNSLFSNGFSKNGNSCLNYLQFFIVDLKNHLENQFEPWMSWNNYGSYSKNIWDDNDQSTWKWNIDHIIPQSLLPYSSMEDENFKKCWALENLRPYSAKQNILDGARASLLINKN